MMCIPRGGYRLAGGNFSRGYLGELLGNVFIDFQCYGGIFERQSGRVTPLCSFSNRRPQLCYYQALLF
jgi:hypothetical protein